MTVFELGRNETRDIIKGMQDNMSINALLDKNKFVNECTPDVLESICGPLAKRLESYGSSLEYSAEDLFDLYDNIMN